MIELKTKNNRPINDTDTVLFYLHGPNDPEEATIELTGQDLKKLVTILNLSIGNTPKGMNPNDVMAWLLGNLK